MDFTGTVARCIGELHTTCRNPACATFRWHCWEPNPSVATEPDVASSNQGMWLNISLIDQLVFKPSATLHGHCKVFAIRTSTP